MCVPQTEAAHTSAMFSTDAVFHAPMFALNVHAPLNTCEPNHTCIYQ
jgi:hypothetical protein